MRLMGAALLFLAPALAQADVFHQRVEGAAAQAFYMHTEGCTAITAIVTGLHARNGSADLTDVVVVSGSLDDICLGESHPFFGAGGSFSINGMASAHASGTVVATSYTDSPPITFEFDLSFTGSGAVTRQASSFRDTGPGGVTLSFLYDTFRAANVSG